MLFYLLVCFLLANEVLLQLRSEDRDDLGKRQRYSWRPLKEKMRELWKNKSFGHGEGTAITVRETKSQEVKSY